MVIVSWSRFRCQPSINPEPKQVFRRTIVPEVTLGFRRHAQSSMCDYLIFGIL